MKKVLAVILCAVMLFCTVPFTAGAVETIPIEEDYVFTASNELESGKTYIIADGKTATVPENLTLYVPEGTVLFVEKGATLKVLGSITTLSGGNVTVDGNVYQAERIRGEGIMQAQVRFPALADVALTNKIAVSYACSTNGNNYEDLSGTLTFTNVSDNGGYIYMPLNSYVYLKAVIREPDAAFNKFDDSLFDVFFNNVGIPFVQGSHNFTLSTAGDISYEQWTTENDYLSTFKIYLPSADGYEVYGRNGEQTASGQTVNLKYGQSFSFRVEIDPDYDLSPYEVYIYNGYGWLGLETENPSLKDIAPATPDEYGYYTINDIKGDTTVYVIGVVENGTINMVGNIIEMIRNIFSMIMSFFNQIIAMFK